MDARHLAGDRGVAHYTSALVATLAREFPGDEYRLLIPGRGALREPGALSHANQIVVRSRLPSRVVFGSAAIAGFPRLDGLLGGDVDVVWAPAPAPLALSKQIPFVLTIHDLSFLDRPADFTPYERLWHRLARPRHLAERAQHVISDSASPRDQLLARSWLPTSRVTVIGPGVGTPPPSSPLAVRSGLDRLGVPDRYLLVVGALEPRKAPELIASAYARARGSDLGCDLVFAGGGRLANRLRGAGVRVLGRVSDANLDLLYRGALALGSASWLEGFGLPPLEAMSAGTPVAVFDNSSLREVVGDAGVVVADGDAAAMAAAVSHLLADARERERRVAIGRERAATFTWVRTATATLDVYRAVLEAR